MLIVEELRANESNYDMEKKKKQTSEEEKNRSMVGKLELYLKTAWARKE